MGMGFEYNCSNCGHQAFVGLGSGFAFPLVYKEVLGAVRSGEYGKQWKDFACQSDTVAIDAEIKLYLCPKCGNWEADHDLSLYEIDNEEIDTSSYVPPYQLEESGYETHHYWHECDKCGSIMLEIAEKQLDHFVGQVGLKCPRCESFNEVGDTSFMWD